MTVRKEKYGVHKRRGVFQPSSNSFPLHQQEQHRKLQSIRVQLRQLGCSRFVQLHNAFLGKGAYDIRVIGLGEEDKLRCAALYQNYLFLKGTVKHVLIKSSFRGMKQTLSMLKHYRKQLYKRNETMFDIYDLTNPEDIQQWQENYNTNHKRSVAVYPYANTNELFHGLRNSEDKFYLIKLFNDR